jgi:hypothetical protein
VSKDPPSDLLLAIWSSSPYPQQRLLGEYVRDQRTGKLGDSAAARKVADRFERLLRGQKDSIFQVRAPRGRRPQSPLANQNGPVAKAMRAALDRSPWPLPRSAKAKAIREVMLKLHKDESTIRRAWSKSLRDLYELERASRFVDQQFSHEERRELDEVPFNFVLAAARLRSTEGKDRPLWDLVAAVLPQSGT